MKLFGLSITRAAPRPPLSPIGAGLSSARHGSGGWLSVIREPSTGAWQRNEEATVGTVINYAPVFACVDLIARDIAKLGLWLVAQDRYGVWTRADAAAFSPVLRKPNRYQTRITFVMQWLVSKLIHGNTYVLKQRDDRNVINALYVLDPTRVVPLVAPDGAVYYELRRDDLSGVANQEPITVPASEIIHDIMIPLFHPLIGVSPIFACGLPALQGLKIQSTSERYFANGAQPGGVLSAPGAILDETAERLKAQWKEKFSGDNAGQIAVLGDGLKYEPLSYNAVDSQLIEQLQWTAREVCMCYHVPAFRIEAAPYPSWNNVEALNQDYYSTCLQALIESFELCLDEGLELPKPYGTEFDINDLIRMDSSTKTKAAADGVGAGCLSPDEARKRYFDLGPVKGGDSPYLQQQYYSLEALSARDADQPFAKPTPATPPTSPDVVPDDDAPIIPGVPRKRVSPIRYTDDDDGADVARLFWAVRTKAIESGLYDA